MIEKILICLGMLVYILYYIYLCDSIAESKVKKLFMYIFWAIYMIVGIIIFFLII